MNFHNDPKPESRREFFRTAMRWVLGSAICAAGAAVSLRKGADGRIETCINKGVCSHCGVYSRCGLPKALSMRRELRRRNREEHRV